jgi:hypothetical protein
MPVTVHSIRRTAAVGAAVVALLSAGCGNLRDLGRSPSQLVIMSLEGASGASPTTFGGSLQSDVLTLRTKPDPCSATSPCPTIFNDLGQVTLQVLLKDQGQAGTTASPSAINQVTITRYHVQFTRTDGGSDVPAAFDSVMTFTVPAGSSATATFDLVQTSAKELPPLVGLRTALLDANGGPVAPTINTMATVTFYGKDQAGNDVSASGSIAVSFANFADPS